VLEEVERGLLAEALRRHGGNQSAAARFLGISRQTLIYRAKKFGLA
jgi:DNA-binding protein Fis